MSTSHCLTIENVLSHYWLDKYRADRATTHRLQMITNVYRDNGDKFGPWYHLHGMMIASFFSQSTGWNDFIEFMESASSEVLYDEHDEQQEHCVNVAGGKVGLWLRRDFPTDRSFHPQGFTPNPAHTDPSRYLSLNEDFRDRISIYSAPELRVRHNRGKLHLADHHRRLYDCTVEVFPASAMRMETSTRIAGW